MDRCIKGRKCMNCLILGQQISADISLTSAGVNLNMRGGGLGLCWKQKTYIAWEERGAVGL